MRNLMITLLIAILASFAYGVEEREGFSKLFDVPSSGGIYPMLTVPSGKTFVLLQINAANYVFNIKANSNIVITGEPLIKHAYETTHNYPDRCVVFEQGDVLELETTQTNIIQVVGYFYNCNCPSIPVADLNKDCKVNLFDFAIMASKWLTDNSVIPV